MSIFLAFAPLLMQLILHVEQSITEAKSGAVKKATVTSIATDVLTGLASVSKGGQANTVSQVTTLLPSMIDLGVAFMNSQSQVVSGKNIIDDSIVTTPVGQTSESLSVSTSVNTMGHVGQD